MIAFFFDGTQSASVDQTNFREKRSPQGNGLFFQTSGSLNLGGLNLPQVASNVRKHLHNLVDTVTNPLNIEIVSQMDPMDVNYQYDYTDQQTVDQQNQNPSSVEYQIVDQQYQNLPDQPPRGSRRHHHRHPPRGHDYPPRGHDYPPRDRDYPSRGPPRGHRPHGHPRGPPYEQPPPSIPSYDGSQPNPDKLVYENVNERDNQNLPETRPNFSQQPNYPGTIGNSNVNVDNAMPKDTSKNSDEQSKDTDGKSNIAEYIEGDFPVILLNENEIR